MDGKAVLRIVWSKINTSGIEIRDKKLIGNETKTIFWAVKWIIVPLKKYADHLKKV